MNSEYKYITVEAKPQELHLILDDNSETNKAIERETKIAYMAPQMLDGLKQILKHRQLAQAKTTAHHILALLGEI